MSAFFTRKICLVENVITFFHLKAGGYRLLVETYGERAITQKLVNDG